MKPIKIIPGYNGIMDLDITHMEQKHTKQAIEQHYNDIKKYKAEQELLKPEHRYENAVIRMNKKLEYFRMKEKADSDAIAKAALERNIQYNIRNKITYGFVPIINGGLRH
jgi:hypothetical protein